MVFNLFSKNAITSKVKKMAELLNIYTSLVAKPLG